jgi:4-carboxymuconolactone decarboxylase
MDIGSAVGRRYGITEQQLLDLPHFEASPAFSGPEKLVLRYAAAMTHTPVEVSDELYAELQNAFSPPQLVELTSAIAWENYRARFNHAFGAEAEGFSEGAACPVAVGRHHGDLAGRGGA